MDPYRHWLDMHASLIYLAKVALQKQLSDPQRGQAFAQGNAIDLFPPHRLPICPENARHISRAPPGTASNADPDIVLDLQPLLDEAYQAGRYDRTIDYGAECVPALDAADDDYDDGRQCALHLFPCSIYWLAGSCIGCSSFLILGFRWLAQLGLRVL